MIVKLLLVVDFYILFLYEKIIPEDYPFPLLLIL